MVTMIIFVSCSNREETLGSKKQIYIKHQTASVIVAFGHLAALFAQSVFVKQVLGHAVLRSAHAAQVGHPVGQLFDGLDLLVQEMCLKMVAQLGKKKENQS